MLKPRVVFVGAAVGLLSLAYALQLSPELGVAATEQAQEFVPVTDEMLLDPDPEDWLMVHRTYDFQAYRALFMTVWRLSTRSAENSCGIRQS